MAVSVSSVTTITQGGAGTNTQLTTSESPTATQVGDLVVIIHCNDFYALANIQNPVATGSPTITAITNGSADGGTDEGHVKSWWYVANTGGAQTVSVNETPGGDEEKGLIVYVLAGADATTPIDVAGPSNSTTNQASHVLSAISPATSNAFLIAHVSSGPGGDAGSYTAPGSMTERYDAHLAPLTLTGATEQLSASGSTGTRTFTPATSSDWAGLLIAVRPAGGGGGGGETYAMLRLPVIAP